MRKHAALLIWLASSSLTAGCALASPSVGLPAKMTEWPTNEANATDAALKQPCRPGHDLRTSDLCAQWKAADAASVSAAWAQWSFWLTLGATAIGLFTLVAAGAAAFFAKQAANEGRRSANAAADGLLQTRKAAAAQLRPYVYFERHEVQVDESPKGGFEIRLLTRNFGTLPAHSVMLQTIKIDVPYPLQDHRFTGPAHRTARRIPPGHSIRRTMNFPSWQRALVGLRAWLIGYEMTYWIETEEGRKEVKEVQAWIVTPTVLRKRRLRILRPSDFADANDFGRLVIKPEPPSPPLP